MSPKNLEGMITSLILGPDEEEEKIIDIPGGVEIINNFPDGDCIKIYSNLIDESTSIGYQPNGTNHEEYQQSNIYEIPKDEDESNGGS